MPSARRRDDDTVAQRDLVTSSRRQLAARISAWSRALVSEAPSIDPQFAKLALFMEQHIPFNKLLGLRVDLLQRGECVLRIPWMDHLLGDVTRPVFS